jgi:hypothetical protein
MNSWPIGYVRKRIGLPGGKENEKGSDRGGLLFAGRPLLIFQPSFRGNSIKGWCRNSTITGVEKRGG